MTFYSGSDETMHLHDTFQTLECHIVGVYKCSKKLIHKCVVQGKQPDALIFTHAWKVKVRDDVWL